MKRPVNPANVDTHGRIRRVEQPPQKLVKLTLMGGPAGPGIDVDLPVHNDYARYGGWRWSWAGKRTPEGRRIFAKVPTSRKLWHFIFWSIGQTGRDPRLNDRPQPFMYDKQHPRPLKHGRGRVRRTHAQTQ